MNIHILSGTLINESNGSVCPDGACLYDSTSRTVFGPLFNDAEQVIDFLCWCRDQYGGVKPETVMDRHGEWLHDRKAASRIQEFCGQEGTVSG